MLFLAILVVVSCVDVCHFSLGTFEHFNLENIPTLHTTLDECGESYHHIDFEVCKNLDVDLCMSVSTIGPGNGCDCYINDETDSRVFWWMGEAKNVTRSKYDKDKKQFVQTFIGINQVQLRPNWRRDLQLTMVCDSDAKTPIVKCLEVQELQYVTVYKLQVTSKDACPHWL